MKAEIAQKINDEIINKITSVLYCYSYTDEEPGEDLIVIRIEKTKVTIEVQMDVTKNLDGVINNCKISTTIKEENNKRKNINNGDV